MNERCLGTDAVQPYSVSRLTKKTSHFIRLLSFLCFISFSYVFVCCFPEYLGAQDCVYHIFSDWIKDLLETGEAQLSVLMLILPLPHYNAIKYYLVLAIFCSYYPFFLKHLCHVSSILFFSWLTCSLEGPFLHVKAFQICYGGFCGMIFHSEQSVVSITAQLQAGLALHPGYTEYYNVLGWTVSLLTLSVWCIKRGEDLQCSMMTSSVSSPIWFLKNV